MATIPQNFGFFFSQIPKDISHFQPYFDSYRSSSLFALPVGDVFQDPGGCRNHG